MPTIIGIITIATMLLAAVVMVVSFDASNKLGQIIATQDAVRANQQKLVMPQHAGILDAVNAVLKVVNERCK